MNLHSQWIDQRRKDHMNMIRHHDGDAQVELDAVVMQTAFEHKRPHKFRQSPPAISTECNEMLLVITLKMRKLPPIKCVPHKESSAESMDVGTAALGCPRSEAPL